MRLSANDRTGTSFDREVIVRQRAESASLVLLASIEAPARAEHEHARGLATAVRLVSLIIIFIAIATKASAVDEFPNHFPEEPQPPDLPAAFGVDFINLYPWYFIHPSGWPACRKPFTVYNFHMRQLFDAFGNPLPPDPRYYTSFIGIFNPTYRSFTQWIAYSSFGGATYHQWDDGTEHAAKNLSGFSRYAPTGATAAQIMMAFDSGQNTCDADFASTIWSSPLVVVPSGSDCHDCGCR